MAANITIRRAYAVILLLFVLTATVDAVRKDVTLGFDELAHASYVAHLQHFGETWPDFNAMQTLYPSTFRFTSKPNYLNHPSPYYALLARLGPTLEGHPESIIFHRLLNIVLATIGLACLMAIGLIAQMPSFTFYAYVIPLACIPVLAPLAGAINNDNAAFAGAGIATLAAFRLLTTGSRTALIAALAGVIIASSAKLTALLLTGGLVGGVLVWLLWRRRLPPKSIGLIVIAALVAVAPYAVLFVQYGSMVPRTPGQIEMVVTSAHTIGWDKAERLSPAAFAMQFISEFVTQWMPTPKPRSAMNYLALAIPIAAMLCAFAGVLLSLHRIVYRKEGPIDVVTVAAAFAFAVTFVIHGIFSYQYHVIYGWLTSAYPRYYLPSVVLVPLAALSLLSAVRQPRARAVLIAFLIAGPVAFQLLGSPLG